MIEIVQVHYCQYVASIWPFAAVKTTLEHQLWINLTVFPLDFQEVSVRDAYEENLGCKVLMAGSLQHKSLLGLPIQTFKLDLLSVIDSLKCINIFPWSISVLHSNICSFDLLSSKKEITNDTLLVLVLADPLEFSQSAICLTLELYLEPVIFCNTFESVCISIDLPF